MGAVRRFVIVSGLVDPGAMLLMVEKMFSVPSYTPLRLRSIQMPMLTAPAAVGPPVTVIGMG
jgi:hypothetical protein